MDTKAFRRLAAFKNLHRRLRYELAVFDIRAAVQPPTAMAVRVHVRTRRREIDARLRDCDLRMLNCSRELLNLGAVDMNALLFTSVTFDAHFYSDVLDRLEVHFHAALAGDQSTDAAVERLLKEKSLWLERWERAYLCMRDHASFDWERERFMRQCRGPLRRRELESLRRIEYDAAAAHEEIEGDLCPICLQRRQLGQVIVELSPCEHRFHAACIEPVLLARARCPLCTCYCVVEICS